MEATDFKRQYLKRGAGRIEPRAPSRSKPTMCCHWQVWDGSLAHSMFAESSVKNSDRGTLHRRLGTFVCAASFRERMAVRDLRAGDDQESEGSAFGS